MLVQSLLSIAQEETIISLDKNNIQKTNIFVKVDTMPELICDFSGNYLEKINSFIEQNLRWPNSEIDCTGKVYVQFVVEIDGSISDINIIRGLDSCEGFNEEAIRVIKLMKNWKPGIKNGKNVRVQLTIPVKFMLK